jgi:hypothetical protein
MSIRSIRERAAATLLRSGTELALDQRELEDRFSAASTRDSVYSSAHGAIAMARWVDSAILWVAWRIHPRTFPSSTELVHRPSLY